MIFKLFIFLLALYGVNQLWKKLFKHDDKSDKIQGKKDEPGKSVVSEEIYRNAEDIEFHEVPPSDGEDEIKQEQDEN